MDLAGAAVQQARGYIAGMVFWAVVQLAILFIQPGQMMLILALSVLAGVGVSIAHVLPDAIFPDVIEWLTNPHHPSLARHAPYPGLLLQDVGLPACSQHTDVNAGRHMH